MPYLIMIRALSNIYILPTYANRDDRSYNTLEIGRSRHKSILRVPYIS